jgi:hypothetical protein
MAYAKPGHPKQMKRTSKKPDRGGYDPGGVPVGPSLFVPTETGSSAHPIQAVFALLDLIVLWVGAYLRICPR